MRARYGDRVRFRPVGERRGWLRRRFGMSGGGPGGGGGAWAADLVQTIEERALWGRFGL